ncbi:MAG: endolytic transglycosylase MltG [Deltaproteobacteria bacterium]|nr:endolytic transglycosylase MltG [Deltaproteobacteria bacterium]
MPKAILLLTAFLFLLFILFTSLWVRYGLGPVNKKGESRNFLVKEGATLNQVAADLENSGLIRNKTLFCLAGRFMENDHMIKTGEYRLSSAMPPLKILEILEKGRVITLSVTIPEGFNSDQIAELLAQKGLAGRDSFMALVRDKSLVAHLGFSGNTLEGYLYPDTYRFQRKEKTDKIITTLVKRFRDIITPLEEQISQSGLALEQVITLASMVEKETGNPEERPMIARVFLNRLDRNMRLESDPTVIYGVTNFNGNITKKDLRTETPYNTYVIKGLPPGPIANPGLAAIKAVLNPAEGNYYYFVSKNNGTHYFSKTLREHNWAVKRFQKSRERKQD